MMRRLFAFSLIALAACAAQPAAFGSSDVPPAPGPGPMQAEATASGAAIEAAAQACARGDGAALNALLDRYPKVSRPMAPDLSENELTTPLRRLCAGAGIGSLAEVSTMVEETTIQPGSALATVTMNGRIRGAGRDEFFVIRGMVFLLQSGSGWKILRAAYWPHEIPPIT